MASLLENQIKSLIGQGFKGNLIKGTFRQVVESSTVDAKGDPVSQTPVLLTCEGIVDTFTEWYRRNAGIPDTDVKILLIADLVAVRPQKGDQVKFRTKWYQLRDVSTDPAEATWEARAFEIADPTI